VIRGSSNRSRWKEAKENETERGKKGENEEANTVGREGRKMVCRVEIFG
jgi:hypothetical protein